MTATMEGRHTNRPQGDVVVFLIGMRVNRWRAVRQWLPVARAMPPMLRELHADPSLGLLGVTSWVGPRGSLAVQYWRDLDSLLSYARSTDHHHRPAWREFNRRVRGSRGAVGVWHETYAVSAGSYESVHVDMPPPGLATALGSLPIDEERDTARQRLQAGS